MLAAVGLGVNSAPTIVASMLISPMMGPILAMSIAANVHNPELARLGAFNFAITMLICIVAGFIVRSCASDSTVATGGTGLHLDHALLMWLPSKLASDAVVR